MNKIVVSVARKKRASEKLLCGLMALLAVLFLVLGIALSRGMMLPCFLMAMAYFLYSTSVKREYEYILENGRMRIDRLTDRGRRTRHDFSTQDIEILACPDDSCVSAYKKGGSVKLPKFDYTSYDDSVPWYTMIVKEEGRLIRLLLDLTPEAINRLRVENPSAIQGKLKTVSA